MNGMEKKRIVYFDLLNIVACFCVILLHCNGIVHTFSNTSAWKQSLVVEVLAFWAVPVFFMLSGATLMNYREKYTTKTFFVKRIMRVLIPFLVWSTITLIWKVSTGQKTDVIFSPRKIMNLYLGNNIESIYWFFIPLFAVYLCMPVLSLLTEEKHRKWLWYMVGAGFLTKSLFPFICPLVGITWPGDLSFPMTGGYVFYVILGYLLSTEELTRKQRVLTYILGIFGAVIRYGYTYFTSIEQGELNRFFFNYMGFFSVFLAVAVFILFKYINWSWIANRPNITKIISQIASCSFGIYLIHMIIIHYMRAFTGWSTSGLLWRTVGAVLVYLVSLGVITILKRIPILKHIIP